MVEGYGSRKTEESVCARVVELLRVDRGIESVKTVGGAIRIPTIAAADCDGGTESRTREDDSSWGQRDDYCQVW